MGLSRFLQQPFQEGSGCVDLSREVALFLIEIYFERHYQADLLFSKKDFIQSYKAGNICDQVTQAMFAFASLYVLCDRGIFSLYFYL